MATKGGHTPAPATTADPGAEPRPTVVALRSVPVVTRRGGQIRVAVSPRTVGARHHVMGEVLLRPGESIAEHVHDYGEESLFIVSGTGTLEADGRSEELRRGLVAYAPRGTSHAVHNTGREDLVIVFASAPLAPAPHLGHRETTGGDQSASEAGRGRGDSG